MTICGTCRTPVTKPAEKIVCTRTNCNRGYHLGCVGIRSTNVKKITTWLCPKCASSDPKTASVNTPDKCLSEQDGSDAAILSEQPQCGHQEAPQPSPHNISQLASGDLAALIRNAVKHELSSMQSQMSTIENTLSYMSNQYDDLLKTLKSTTAEVKKLKDENTILRNTIDENSVRIKRLEEDNARQQQWSRLQNIEVIGIPENKDEDTTQIVVKLADKIGIKLEGNDVEFAHRVQSRKSSSLASSRTIIARLRHRHTKDTLIAAARKHRNLKPSDIGLSAHNTLDSRNTNIYINEHLTHSNRALLKLCKNKAKETMYKYVWTKNCRIYVRRDEKSPPIPIITDTDLSKIC